MQGFRRVGLEWLVTRRSRTLDAAAAAVIIVIVVVIVTTVILGHSFGFHAPHSKSMFSQISTGFTPS